MKKMKTVFRIDRDQRRATSEVMDAAAWVVAGEGVATIKFDGTAAMVCDNKLYKRYDRRPEKHFAKRLKCEANFELTESMFKSAPLGFEPCESSPDHKTGHWHGWLPVGDGPEDRWFREAWEHGPYVDGTYELVGPKVQGNRYNLERHELWLHGSKIVNIVRTFEGIRDWLSAQNEEGLVFHHPDGRMAKIRRKDFQLDW